MFGDWDLKVYQVIKKLYFSRAFSPIGLKGLDI